ncbi:MAG TPA: F0F1 ATP synthase subunit epsilon [Candidatus Kapabacteria bacterium]|nr:F0F1 ATP synthase subunit epsilon [Candidatus Kapabacteria bacterium]
MFDNPFTFELITPDRTLFSGEVRSVTIPGVVGNFQVLRSHAPLITSLEIGRIRLRDKADATHDFATSGGFVEVKNNVCTLIAETAEPADGIDVDRAKRAKERAEQRIKAQRSEQVDPHRARTAFLRAINRIKVAEQK